MIFSERLKTLRTTNRLSQRELADRIGVGKSQISYYENGEDIAVANALKKKNR